MAVAISSCALGFIAFVCSFLTVTFHALGKNPRSSELVLLLSTLTGNNYYLNGRGFINWLIFISICNRGNDRSFSW